MRTYGDCTYCGGAVQEQRARVDYRYHGQLFIMEDVPLGICCQCGERFVAADVAKKLEAAATHGNQGVKTVAVPVISIAA